MTIDEKLDEFYNSAIDSATRQSSQQIKEYKDSLQKIYDDHKKESQEKLSVALRLGNENFLREKNRRISAETIHIRRQTNEKAKELTEILFKEVTKKLESFMKTEAYLSLLVKQINDAKNFSKGEAITIYLNPSDEDKKQLLEQQTGFVLTISSEDFLGGTRATIESKRILIDNSFLTKLSEEKSVFTLL